MALTTLTLGAHRRPSRFLIALVMSDHCAKFEEDWLKRFWEKAHVIVFLMTQLPPLKIVWRENFEVCWGSVNMTNNHAKHEKVSSKSSRDMTKFIHAYPWPKRPWPWVRGNEISGKWSPNYVTPSHQVSRRSTERFKRNRWPHVSLDTHTDRHTHGHLPPTTRFFLFVLLELEEQKGCLTR